MELNEIICVKLLKTEALWNLKTFTQKNNKMVIAFVERELLLRGTKNLASELAGNILYFVVDILV